MKTKPAVALLNATVLVVSECGEQGLLVRTKKRKKTWELPGGKIDRKESLPAGAVREVREETGIHIRLEAMTAMYKCARQDGLYFVFLGRPTGGKLCPQPKEIVEVSWFPLEKLTDSMSCGLHRQRVEDCLNYNGSPVYRLVRKRPYELFETWDLGPSSPEALRLLDDVGSKTSESPDEFEDVDNSPSSQGPSTVLRELGPAVAAGWRGIRDKIGSVMSS